MRLLTTSMLAIAAIAAAPASAAVLGFSGVALGTTPTTFSFAPGSSFSLSYDAAAASNFDTSPYALSTSGTGESSLTFGLPSSFFTRGITIDGNLFPGFGPVPTLTDIPSSITPTDLALRYSVGGDFYYGYARLVNGSVDIAFESQANTAIVAGSAIVGAPAGAVPEPATWAMMIGGFGLVGSAMRRRARTLAAA